MDNMVTAFFHATKAITKEFSDEVGKMAKPYMRHLTAEMLGSGLPAGYLQYGFYIVFDGRRQWGVSPKDKSLLTVMNSVVAQEMLVPNYVRQNPDQDYMSNINEALVETAKWVRVSVAPKLQNTFDKIVTKHTVKLAKKYTAYSQGGWKQEVKDAINGSPSLYPGGRRSARILYSLFR